MHTEKSKEINKNRVESAKINIKIYDCLQLAS